MSKTKPRTLASMATAEAETGEVIEFDFMRLLQWLDRVGSHAGPVQNHPARHVHA